jgi:hypothetical protein
MSNSKSPNSIFSCLVLVAGAFAIPLVAVLYFHRGEPAIPFKPVSPQAFLGLIGWLAAVALFVERAVEVVVTVCRDQGADAIAIKQKHAAADAKKADAAVTAAGPAAADALRQASAAAHKDAEDADDEMTVYSAITKEFALKVSFCFSLLVSLAGVRALHGLVPDNAVTGRLFTVADIVVTGALLAGGSEGIHRLANVYTSFTDSASRRLDAKNLDKNSAAKGS